MIRVPFTADRIGRENEGIRIRRIPVRLFKQGLPTFGGNHIDRHRRYIMRRIGKEGPLAVEQGVQPGGIGRAEAEALWPLRQIARGKQGIRLILRPRKQGCVQGRGIGSSRLDSQVPNCAFQQAFVRDVDSLCIHLSGAIPECVAARIQHSGETGGIPLHEDLALGVFLPEPHAATCKVERCRLRVRPVELERFQFNGKILHPEPAQSRACRLQRIIRIHWQAGRADALRRHTELHLDAVSRTDGEPAMECSGQALRLAGCIRLKEGFLISRFENRRQTYPRLNSLLSGLRVNRLIKGYPCRGDALSQVLNPHLRQVPEDQAEDGLRSTGIVESKRPVVRIPHAPLKVITDADDLLPRADSAAGEDAKAQTEPGHHRGECRRPGFSEGQGLTFGHLRTR